MGPKGFPEELARAGERGRPENGSKVPGQSWWKDAVPTAGMERAMGKTGEAEKVQDSTRTGSASCPVSISTHGAAAGALLAAGSVGTDKCITVVTRHASAGPVPGEMRLDCRTKRPSGLLLVGGTLGDLHLVLNIRHTR